MADHLSIGEVLTLLRDEFPEVTISKIRFLESQGLIDPERTPSGYRKFYDADVERLTWVLRQQRDHYLPLKVIKARLDEGDAGAVAPVPPADEEPGAEASAPRRKRSSSRARAPERLPLPELDADDASEPEPLPSSGASMNRSELAHAAGLSEDGIVELESFGLLRPVGGERAGGLFDDDALVIARVAAKFGRHGVEARHLRMYRSFADREAALFEQVLLPLLRQRNPQSRDEARRAMGELAELGKDLRAALLRNAVRNALPET